MSTASANQMMLLIASRPLPRVTRRIMRSVGVNRWPNRAMRPTVTKARPKNMNVSEDGVDGPHSTTNVLRFEFMSIVW